MPADPGRPDPPKTTNGYISCPQCGLPHRRMDTVCSFCETPLAQKARVTDRLRGAIESFKWRYKLKSPRANPAAAAKRYGGDLVTLLLGVALASIGVWFFLSAVSSSSFSEFLIGALFLFYGVYCVINVLKSNR